MVVNLEERSIVSINHWSVSLIFDQDENLAKLIITHLIKI